MSINGRIKNSTLLAKTSLRQVALQLAETALIAIATDTAIKRVVRISGQHLHLAGQVYKLTDFRRVVLMAVGKCALSASVELEKILGGALSGGIVLDLETHPTEEHLFRYFQGDHPLPTERNIEATKEIIKLLKDLHSTDLVIFVISGGASTLLCQPRDHTVELERNILKELTKSGATIQEINTVRKHLSLARGGWLADYAYPATACALIFSDIPGADPSFVASGPTFYNDTNVFQADFILDQYHLRERLDLPSKFLIETPKQEKNFSRTKNEVIVSNLLALEAIVEEAKSLGYRPIICDTKLAGEAKQIGPIIAKVLHQSPPGTLLLYGGETTVKITGKGQGGRNQELVLGALKYLESDELILALASDGRDNGPHGGALGDENTLAQAQVLGLSVEQELADNNSAYFFERVGDYLKINPTGANVADLILALKSH